MPYIFLYLLIMNVLGLYLMYADKKRAKQQVYRIKERTLWRVSFLGGVFGTLIGMNVFRHKTKHSSFKWGLPTLAIIEIVILFYFLT